VGPFGLLSNGAHRDVVPRREQGARREAVHAHREAAHDLLQHETAQVDRLLRRLVEDADELLPAVHCRDLQAAAGAGREDCAGPEGPTHPNSRPPGSDGALMAGRPPHLHWCPGYRWPGSVWGSRAVLLGGCLWIFWRSRERSSLGMEAPHGGSNGDVPCKAGQPCSKWSVRGRGAVPGF
jgi:hypothetical protein